MELIDEADTEVGGEKATPYELVPLRQRSLEYGQLAKRVERFLTHKLNQPITSPVDKEDEIKIHWESLRDRFYKITKNTRNNIRECLDILNYNQKLLTELEEELATDPNEWKYWEEVCPICLNYIRLDCSVANLTPAGFQTTPCCRKLFHLDCLQRHLVESKKCPHCRYDYLVSHLLYSRFTNLTPEEAREQFDRLSADQIRKEFSDLSSHNFRSIFDEWVKHQTEPDKNSKTKSDQESVSIDLQKKITQLEEAMKGQAELIQTLVGCKNPSTTNPSTTNPSSANSPDSRC